MTDPHQDAAVMTGRDNTSRDNAGRPGRTLAEAARELQGILRAQRARERAGRDVRQLERLQQQAARRRAAAEKAGLTDD